MHIFAVVVIARLAGMVTMRITRAIRVVSILIKDRELARSLPWTYIRHTARRDPWIIWQLVGLFSLLVLFPVSVLIPVSLELGIPILFAVLGMSALLAHSMSESRQR